jgi:hypothetical protein
VATVDNATGGSTGEIAVQDDPQPGANFSGSGLARWDLPAGVFGVSGSGASAGTDGGGAGVGSITYTEDLQLLLPGFDGTVFVGLNATLDGETGGSVIPVFNSSAAAEVFLQVQGWPSGFPGLGDVDTFFFQGGINFGVDSGIEQRIHEDISILFPVFVTAGSGPFTIQVDLLAGAGANAGQAFSDFGHTAVLDMSLPVGASLVSESGFLSQSVPEGDSLALLGLGSVALFVCLGAQAQQPWRRTGP